MVLGLSEWYISQNNIFYFKILLHEYHENNYQKAYYSEKQFTPFYEVKTMKIYTN